jgi:hypothetical protein
MRIEDLGGFKTTTKKLAGSTAAACVGGRSATGAPV